MKTTLIKFLQTEMNWNPINISFIEKLGGLSSENYKVSYNNNDYFVKICIADYLHTDRINELSILNKVSKINLAPNIYYFSNKSGNMITSWIDGSMPSLDDFNSSNFLNMLSNSLKSLHNLKCEKQFNPFNDIRKRIEICKDLNLPLPKSINILLEFLTYIEYKLNKSPLIGLCHNDLNASNIILTSNKLYFVDYEYSSMGDIFFDLATISWFFSEKSRKDLLKFYFGEYNPKDYEKLLDFIFIVKFYNASWSLLKSTDLNINYDYLSGAKMIFKDLLKNDSIRNF
ncbi:choline kinase family protein [Clostridium sp.]|uniref:choline kinase family protein n=1 Tax=Clostridium sp. TaxID=1506 RepID=UPI0025B988BC|nr:choline kinase family protein [Clostridium sp.]